MRSDIVQTSLVVMAAGMGSRYGGLKQMDPIGPNGELIIDYSVYDAYKAGFNKVVFIIKKENEKDFRELIGKRAEKVMDVDYAFQRLDNLPQGFSLPTERVKPWGTAHAVLSCKGIVDTPFAVINADDFYGRTTYKLLHDYLSNAKDESGVYDFCMVGFILENTLTESGTVARGLCKVSSEGYLEDIRELTAIKSFPDGVKHTEDGESWHPVPKGSVVSMNTWGFTLGILDEIADGFPGFLKDSKDNILKAEYYLPSVVDRLIKDKKARVKVLNGSERWYGVTYREDKPFVQAAIAGLVNSGVYPRKLWEEF